jgi:hypothetical protein
VAVFRIRSRFARLSFVSVVATTFIAGVAMTPAFAQATKLSKADQRLLKAAIHSCKSEAKAKKVKLLSRRQFVVDCVQTLKDRPQVNVQEVLKNHPDLKDLPCPPNPDPGYRLVTGLATPLSNVRYWHLADMGQCTAHVRFRG